MESEQRRKRKRTSPKPYSSSHLFSIRSLILCLSFFVFLLFLSTSSSSSDRTLGVSTASFRPVLSASPLSLLSSSATNSILGTLNHRPLRSAPRVEGRILFPDHVLLLVSNGVDRREDLECVYHALPSNSSDRHAEVAPAMSVDVYSEHRSIVRCPILPANISAAEVELRRRGGAPADGGEKARSNRTAAVQSWDRLVYDAELDGETAVVFVKGLNLRPYRKSNPAQFSCHFGWGGWDKDETFVLTTKAVSAAQEVIRCPLPRSIRSNPIKAQGVRVTIGSPFNYHTHGRSSVHVPMPSVARICSPKGMIMGEERRKKTMTKHDLCACTMVWNQAASLREWIIYHAWLGIDRWFIYDNNSDDAIKEVIQELDSQNYNVSRQSWPWIKTQEAGFSHCVLRARDECNWVGFFDVDEFFYFPFPSSHRRGLGFPGKDTLKAMVANLSSSSPIIAEIRTVCHSFGPSGLTSPPLRGVMVGYTCRLQQPERHKSIVRPDALDPTLLNEVHHFRLKEGFRYLNVPESIAVINHYKYQVWETFRTKFFRRVATYVADWQEDQNKGSKDRAPGLGTEAIEPPDWRLQFCEVWDTGLRDFVLANFAHPATSTMLPWERSSSVSR